MVSRRASRTCGSLSANRLAVPCRENSGCGRAWAGFRGMHGLIEGRGARPTVALRTLPCLRQGTGTVGSNRRWCAVVGLRSIDVGGCVTDGGCRLHKRSRITADGHWAVRGSRDGHCVPDRRCVAVHRRGAGCGGRHGRTAGGGWAQTCHWRLAGKPVLRSDRPRTTGHSVIPAPPHHQNSAGTCCVKRVVR